MDFTIPADIAAYLAELDAFIEREIRPLERQDDNIRFFDHRREWARTDFENEGLPRPEWEAPLWIVTHVDLHRTLKVQSFLAHLKRAAADWVLTCN